MKGLYYYFVIVITSKNLARRQFLQACSACFILVNENTDMYITLCSLNNCLHHKMAKKQLFINTSFI